MIIFFKQIGVNDPKLLLINLEWEIVGYSSVEVRLIYVFCGKVFHNIMVSVLYWKYRKEKVMLAVTKNKV